MIVIMVITVNILQIFSLKPTWWLLDKDENIFLFRWNEIDVETEAKREVN